MTDARGHMSTSSCCQSQRTIISTRRQSANQSHRPKETQGRFAAAAKKLEERAGVTVISPAVTPEGLKKADYMRICFAMLESADTAVFLPDWEDSPGAQLEKHWCEYVGKKMVFLMEGAE